MPARMHRPLVPLVKPASGDCQLLCRYCFYRVNPAAQPPGSGARMSAEVLERFTREYLAYQPIHVPANICWQGGEPLLMGLDFFRQAVALQRRYRRPGQAVVNSLQTNGLGLDRAWARFLREERFLVGISLDGPADVHDAARKDRLGRPTFDQVMAAIDRMRSEGVQFNILTVLHRDNAAQAGRLYAFFRDQGFRYLQFIPCVEPGSQPGQLAPFSILPEQYGDALLAIFHAWRRDLAAGRRISERLFDHAINRLAGAPSGLCLFQGHCDGQIVIEHDGAAYPCDWHVSDPWRLGNLMDCSLADLMDSPPMQAFIERSHRRPARCAACPWEPLCHGGCPKHREILTGRADSPNVLCEAYRRFWQETLPVFRAVVRSLRGSSDPAAAGQRPSAPGTAGPARNRPCPCGSGRKFKHCCGSPAGRPHGCLG